jgi:hypothetical protein
LWRDFDQIEVCGDGSFYRVLQRYDAAVFAVCVDEPNRRDTDLPIYTI